MRRLAFFLLLGWTSASLAQNHPELAWQVVETEHFRIFYHEGLDGAAARAARIAETAYAPITELYGYAPDGRVRIVLKDHDDYANGAAFFYQDTIEIWATSLDHDFDLRGSSDWLRNVITHEFAHIISLGAARKGVQRVPALYLQYFGYQREKNRPGHSRRLPGRHCFLSGDGHGGAHVAGRGRGPVRDCDYGARPLGCQSRHGAALLGVGGPAAILRPDGRLWQAGLWQRIRVRPRLWLGALYRRDVR